MTHFGAVVYTSKTCQPCRLLKMWLQQNNIPYEERNGPDHMDEIEKLGVGFGVPITVYRDHKIVGFNPNELKKAFPL